jgi:hypothetical protein
MKHTFENHKGQLFEVELIFKHTFIGRGAYLIVCAIDYKGFKETFLARTTASEHIDTLRDMRDNDASHEDIQQFYLSTFLIDIEEEIVEWLASVNEEII